MREPRILLCGPSPVTMEPQQALDLLLQTAIPNATRCVVANGKFDTGEAAKTFNIDGSYSPDPPRLQTLAAWAGLPERSPQQLRDGLDLLALRGALRKYGKFDYAVLQRDRSRTADRWDKLRKDVDGKIFAVFGTSLLLDLRDERAAAFLDRVSELYLTGAVYALDDYNLRAALAVAAETVRLEPEIASA